MRTQLFALTAIALTTTMTVAQAAPLALNCNGTADVPQVMTRSDSSGKTEDYRSTQRVQANIRVRLDGDSGKIKLPPSMLSGASNDEGGWLNLSRVSTGESTIRGEIKIFFLNTADFVIERNTGNLDITNGNTHFSGTCEKDTAATSTTNKF